MQVFDSALLVFDFVVILLNVVVIIADVAEVSLDVSVVLLNQVLEAVDIVVEVHKGLSCCLEGNHHFSLGLDTLLVLILVPNFFPHIKVVDVVPEVASWHFSFDVFGVVVILLIVVMVVGVMFVVIMVVIVFAIGMVVGVVMVVDNNRRVVSVLAAMPVVVSLIVILHIRVLGSVIDFSTLHGCVGLVPVGFIAAWVEIPQSGLCGSGNSSK